MRPRKAPAAALALVLVLASLVHVACGSSSDAGSASAPAEPVTPTPPEPAPAPPEPESDELCARVIVVSWSGAPHAPEGVTRSESEARERAEQLHARLEAGEDFATIARTESDASSSGPRGGLLGTYARDEWPAAHEPIRAPIEGLRIGETSHVLQAPYGWVIAQRCPIERLHTRHILVRYAGARNAGPEVTRTREQAHARASELLQRARNAGTDFAELARVESEDASAERGGDLGTTGRGRLAPAYEEAVLAVSPGTLVDHPVETEFGFHVIQRLPD